MKTTLAICTPILISFISLETFASSSIEQDLKLLCELYERAETKHPRDPNAAGIYLQRIVKLSNPELSMVYAAILTGEPQEVYILLRHAVEMDLLQKNWKCFFIIICF